MNPALASFLAAQDKKKELESNILILSLIHNLCFQDYRILAEWLGTYRYTKPTERTLIPELAEAIVRYKKPSSASLFYSTVFNHLAVIEHHPVEIQERILKWIRPRI